MSTAAQARRELSALGRDLSAARGGRAERRGDALRGGCVVARSFEELATAPGWLRSPPAELARLARQVALQASARELATLIDGKRLGRIAEQCGEDDLDAAITRADADDDRPLADDPEQAGMALLATTLPPALRGYLTPQPPADVAAARVEAWIARVRA